MRPIFLAVLMIMAVALPTAALNARTHHRAAKTTAPVRTTKLNTKIPVEMKRDPADVALDHKIKGICKGC